MRQQGSGYECIPDRYFRSLRTMALVRYPVMLDGLCRHPRIELPVKRERCQLPICRLKTHKSLLKLYALALLSNLQGIYRLPRALWMSQLSRVTRITFSMVTQISLYLLTLILINRS